MSKQAAFILLPILLLLGGFGFLSSLGSTVEASNPVSSQNMTNAVSNSATTSVNTPGSVAASENISVSENTSISSRESSAGSSNQAPQTSTNGTQKPVRTQTRSFATKPAPGIPNTGVSNSGNTIFGNSGNVGTSTKVPPSIQSPSTTATPQSSSQTKPQSPLTSTITPIFTYGIPQSTPPAPPPPSPSPQTQAAPNPTPAPPPPPTVTPAPTPTIATLSNAAVSYLNKLSQQIKQPTNPPPVLPSVSAAPTTTVLVPNTVVVATSAAPKTESAANPTDTNGMLPPGSPPAPPPAPPSPPPAPAESSTTPITHDASTTPVSTTPVSTTPDSTTPSAKPTSPSTTENSDTIFATGGVTFRFDDGWKSQYDVAVPALDAAGFRGTFYIVTRQLSDDGFSGFVSKSEVQQLAKKEEVGAHTRSHPHLPELTISQQRNEIAGSKSDLQAMGISPTSFAYPYGEYTRATTQIVKDAGFSSAVSTIETAANQNSDRFQIEGLSLKSSDTAASVDKLIDRAVANHQWLVLTFHQIDNGGDQYSMTPNTFRQIVSYVASHNIRVVTVSEGSQALK